MCASDSYRSQYYTRVPNQLEQADGFEAVWVDSIETHWWMDSIETHWWMDTNDVVTGQLGHQLRNCLGGN